MKIGIDARLWKETGVGRYIRNLVCNLVIIDKSNDYVLFILEKDEKDIKDQISKVKNSDKLETGNWKLVIANIGWHSLAEQIHFPKIIREENLDLMHFTYYSVPFLYKEAYVITLHDLIIYHSFTGKASTLPFPLYYLKYIVYKFLLSQVKNNARKIIVPLESTKHDVENIFPAVKEKLVVTKEGFDESLIEKGEVGERIKRLSGRGYFLYVGNAYPHKNVERLIEAFNLFRQNHPEHNLILVGKKDFFYSRLEKDTTSRHMQFLHDISDIELAYLYKHAIALVAPSKMEGFGLPVLEAMSLSCLVLASNISAFKEICQDAAIYFDPLNTNDIATALRTAYNLEDKLLKNYLLQGEKRAKDFSWERMVKETIKIYESCLGI